MDSDTLNLLDELGSIPDPRAARGRRHPLRAQLALVVVGLMMRQVTFVAMVDWLRYHQGFLPILGFLPRFGIPHQSTISRTLARLPESAVQEAFARWMSRVIRTLPTDRPLIVSVDGKYPHQTVDASGDPLGVLSVFVHGVKQVLAQWVVEDHDHEVAVLKGHLEELLARYPQIGGFTFDALFAQRPLCQMLVDAKKAYLVRIKSNQPKLRDFLAAYFAENAQREADYQLVEKVGRLVVTRQVWVGNDLAPYMQQALGFPGAQQAARLDRTTRDPKTGKVSKETSFIISYNPAGRLTPKQLLERSRGHWGIENNLHHPKDRSWNEDKHWLRGAGGVFSFLVGICLTLLQRPGFFDEELSLPRRAYKVHQQPTIALEMLIA